MGTRTHHQTFQAQLSMTFYCVFFFPYGKINRMAVFQCVCAFQLFFLFFSSCLIETLNPYIFVALFFSCLFTSCCCFPLNEIISITHSVLTHVRWNGVAGSKYFQHFHLIPRLTLPSQPWKGGPFRFYYLFWISCIQFTFYAFHSIQILYHGTNTIHKMAYFFFYKDASTYLDSQLFTT